MKKISKCLVQDIYCSCHLSELLCRLKFVYREIFSFEDVIEAFDKASTIYLENNYQSDFDRFVNATTYERGKKLERSQYEGMYRFFPLLPWTKWKMRRSGKYVPLEDMMPAYWLFLVIFIEQKVTTLDIIEMKENVIQFWKKH